MVEKLSTVILLPYEDSRSRLVPVSEIFFRLRVVWGTKESTPSSLIILSVVVLLLIWNWEAITVFVVYCMVIWSYGHRNQKTVSTIDDTVSWRWMDGCSWHTCLDDRSNNDVPMYHCEKKAKIEETENARHEGDSCSCHSQLIGGIAGSHSPSCNGNA